MKKFRNDYIESFSKFNPEKFYAGKIGNFVVDLQPISYNSNLYQWNVCDSTNLNNYNGGLSGLRESQIFTSRNNVINDMSEFYEFDTAKEKYKWISDNL